MLQKRYPQGARIAPPRRDAEWLERDARHLEQHPDGLYGPKTDARNEQVSGMKVSSPGLFTFLAMGTLTCNQRRSFTRAGFDYVYDHEPYDWTTGARVVNSNDSGTHRRSLQAAGTMPAAVVNPATAINLAATSNSYLVLRGLVPAELVPNGPNAANWDWIHAGASKLKARVTTRRRSAGTLPGA